MTKSRRIEKLNGEPVFTFNPGRDIQWEWTVINVILVLSLFVGFLLSATLGIIY